MFTWKIPFTTIDLYDNPNLNYELHALWTPLSLLTILARLSFPAWQQCDYHAQEVGGTLIGENGLVLKAGAESVEYYHTHGFQVFDAIPFAPFRTLL